LNLKPFHTIAKTALPSEKILMVSMPDSIKRGILLLPGAGGALHDPEIPCRRKARLQAVIRETEYQRGYDLALLVSAALTKSRFTSEGVYIATIEPLHDPIFYKRSLGDYIEFSVNFETIFNLP